MLINFFFTLRAADDLADAGREHVHGGHRLAVVVDPHVERKRPVRAALCR